MIVDPVFPLFCTIALASAWQQHQSALLREPGFKVPGDNDLDYCGDPKDYSFDIDYLDVRPNPPIAGENVSIQTEGSLSKDIDAANIHLTVKWNYVTLISATYDLCEAADIDPDCPLRKGHLNVTKKLEIPSSVPAGKYSVTADVQIEGQDGEDEHITCLKGTVIF